MKQGTEVQCKAICISVLARSVLELHPTRHCVFPAVLTGRWKPKEW